MRLAWFVEVLAIMSIVIVFLNDVSAQNSIKTRGSISIGGFHYYDNQNIRQGLKPFGASFQANASISYKQFSLPFRISINNQGTSFQNPFNRYGISPRYKWIRLHLGWRSMRFSNFTMRGVQFFGAGMELSPGNFRFGLMHGKIKYTIPGVPQELTDRFPKRKISAVKIGWEKKNKKAIIVAMKAQDSNIDNDSLIVPKENLAIGLDISIPFFIPNIFFKIDGGISIFSENQNAGTEFLQGTQIPSIANDLFTFNNSTHINYAVESDLLFNFGLFSLNSKYVRIMPEYQSLGLNYLRNDLEAITISPSLRIMDNRIFVSGSLGLEKNNLDGLRNHDQSRFISSANLSVRPSHSHQINLQFSNYNFDQSIQFDSLISNDIVIQQVNTSYGGTYIYSRYNSEYSNVLSFSGSYQLNNNVQNESLDNSTLSTMLNYTFSRMQSSTSITIGANYFETKFSENSVKQCGLNLGYRYTSKKSIFSCRVGSLYELQNGRFNSHLSGNYRHNLSELLSLELSNRLRLNQNAAVGNRWINRTDLRIVMRFK